MTGGAEYAAIASETNQAATQRAVSQCSRAGEPPMVSAVTDVVDQTWEQVSLWPQEWRLSLAQRLLNSINESALGSPTPSRSPGELIGAWKVANPPSDAAVEQILEEERQRKYG